MSALEDFVSIIDMRRRNFCVNSKIDVPPQEAIDAARAELASLRASVAAADRLADAFSDHEPCSMTHCRKCAALAAYRSASNG